MNKRVSHPKILSLRNLFKFTRLQIILANKPRINTGNNPYKVLIKLLFRFLACKCILGYEHGLIASKI